MHYGISEGEHWKMYPFTILPKCQTSYGVGVLLDRILEVVSVDVVNLMSYLIDM